MINSDRPGHIDQDTDPAPIAAGGVEVMFKVKPCKNGHLPGLRVGLSGGHYAFVCSCDQDTPRSATIGDAVKAWNTRVAEQGASPNDRYVITKGGYYYRPNAQGYTTDVEQAGRFTLHEAIQYSHPNGPDGPRDGIDYTPAPPATFDVARENARLRVEVEAKSQWIERLDREVAAKDAELATLRVALIAAKTWHEDELKAISKGHDYGWARHKHLEQIETIDAALGAGDGA